MLEAAWLGIALSASKMRSTIWRHKHNGGLNETLDSDVDTTFSWVMNQYQTRLR